MGMTNNLIISFHRVLREVKLIIQFPVPLIHQLDLVEEGEAYILSNWTRLSDVTSARTSLTLC
jgi:hypothetical protein